MAAAVEVLMLWNRKEFNHKYVIMSFRSQNAILPSPDRWERSFRHGVCVAGRQSERTPSDDYELFHTYVIGIGI